jgi:hypothetical protein
MRFDTAAALEKIIEHNIPFGICNYVYQRKELKLIS